MKKGRIIVHKQKLLELNELEREEELNLLYENINLLLKHKKVIYRKKEFFFCILSQTFIGDSITGLAVLPIGILLKLWEKGHFLHTCPDCGGTVYILSAGGSILSGSHQFRAICPRCKKEVVGRKPSFSQLNLPAHKLVNKYRNVEIIEMFKNQYFEIGRGLVGKKDEQIVLEKMVKVVSLKELIEYLKKEEDR